MSWSAGLGLDIRPTLRRARLAVRPTGAAPSGLVSIIMPVRDRVDSIGRAVASVLAQSYQNWELLILDDGSTDGTKDALRPYLRHPRILYFSLPARGAAAARNAGLRLARGEFVAYLDSDNEWEPDFCAGIVPAFADPAVQSAYGILLTEMGEQFTPFDRAKLLFGNQIDLNVFMHRRALFTQHGGFDENLTRLIDWELVLRYTEASPARPVPVRGAHYHTHAPNRISATESYATAYQHIRAKWQKQGPALRVLYALSQFPQASETYMEAEIAWMRRQGVHVEVWSELFPSAPHPTDLTLHRGTLAQAIAAARPDIVHTHWLNCATQYASVIAASNLPLTARSHGFDIQDGTLQAILANPAVARLYVYPHQANAAGLTADEKLRLIWPGFDTSLVPATLTTTRDSRLVLRAAAGLASKDLPFFMEMAKRFPEHRFVLAATSCTYAETYIGELLALRRQMESPVDLRINMPHEEMLALMGQAGIYLHTAVPPSQPPGTPLGMPISIAEAMASGCYVISRNFGEFEPYLGDAGAFYADIDEAAALIAATQEWSPAQWHATTRRAQERAWMMFNGEISYNLIYQDWLELAAAQQA